MPRQFTLWNDNEQFFFNQYFFCELPKDGYVNEQWCKICMKWQGFKFAESERFLFVNCAGCGRDLKYEVNFSNEMLENMKRERVVIWEIITT